MATSNRRSSTFLFGVLGVAILLCPLHASADEDPWLGPDKAKHFGACATIAMGGYSVGAVAFDDRTSAMILGGSLAIAAGLGKEIYDAAGYGTPSERDLVWDLAGTAVGLGVAWLFDVLIRGDLNESPHDSNTGRRAAIGITF